MPPLSRESHELLEFVESDQNVLIFHLDNPQDAFLAFRKLQKFTQRHSLDIILIRRGAAIYAIKEDKEWLIR